MTRHRSESLHSLIHLSERSIGQAEVHSLDLSVVLQGVRAKLATDTGLLETTERHLSVEHVVAVDPDGTIFTVSVCSVESTSDDGYIPSTHLVGHAEGGVDVLGVNTSGKTCRRSSV